MEKNSQSKNKRKFIDNGYNYIPKEFGIINPKLNKIKTKLKFLNFK